MIEAKQGQHRYSKMYSQLIKILSQCFQIPVLNFKNYIFSLQQDVEKWTFYKLSQEVELHQPLNVKFASMMET
jgi:predicted ATP-grasp superfamily ATP-dependent carboligase